MNITYFVPFWPHLYTPWLFREIAWMRGRGHRVAVVSLKQWHDGQINVTNYNLQDVPVLQVRRNYQGDLPLLKDVAAAALALAGAGGRARVASHAGAASGETRLRPNVAACGVRQGAQTWATVRRMINFVRRQGTQVIEAQWATEAADAARVVGAATGVPYTVTMEGGDLYRTPSPTLPRIVASAAALCPVSQFLADLLQRKVTADYLPAVPECQVDLARLRVRHHGVPAETLAAEPAPQRDDLQVVVSTGRLDPEKRQHDLIEAAAPLAARFPGLRLCIIGGGRREAELKELAAKLGIAERVDITGPLPWPKVIERVKAAHIYVSTSQVEGCSSATLEGASQGLPVLASRTGAHDRVVEEGVNGYLFDVADVPALRRHLERLLSDTDLRRRMGRESLRVMRQHFVFDDLMLRVERMLEAVVGRKALPQ